MLEPLVLGSGAGDTASLTTSDSYLGNDGVSHETAESVALGSGGGVLYRSGTPLMQMSGFTGVYAYMGHADYGLLSGTAGLSNVFVSAGSYAYMDSGPTNFYFVGGAQYVYGTGGSSYFSGTTSFTSPPGTPAAGGISSVAGLPASCVRSATSSAR